MFNISRILRRPEGQGTLTLIWAWKVLSNCQNYTQGVRCANYIHGVRFVTNFHPRVAADLSFPSTGSS